MGTFTSMLKKFSSCRLIHYRLFCLSRLQLSYVAEVVNMYKLHYIVNKMQEIAFKAEAIESIKYNQEVKLQITIYKPLILKRRASFSAAVPGWSPSQLYAKVGSSAGDSRNRLLVNARELE